MQVPRVRQSSEERKHRGPDAFQGLPERADVHGHRHEIVLFRHKRNSQTGTHQKCQSLICRACAHLHRPLIRMHL